MISLIVSASVGDRVHTVVNNKSNIVSIAPEPTFAFGIGTYARSLPTFDGGRTFSILPNAELCGA